jgi:hypothetical protein
MEAIILEKKHKTDPTTILYNKYQYLSKTVARKYASSLTDRSYEVCDLEQELDIKLITSIRSYSVGNAKSPLKLYLNTAVTNKAKDLVNKKRILVSNFDDFQYGCVQEASSFDLDDNNLEIDGYPIFAGLNDMEITIFRLIIKGYHRNLFKKTKANQTRLKKIDAHIAKLKNIIDFSQYKKIFSPIYEN